MHKADEIFKEYGLEGYLILEKGKKNGYSSS